MPDVARLAYADPPYPGRAHLYPENEEVDHAALVARLCTFDGWALSTDSPSLQYVLALCPAGVKIAAWVRTNAPPFNPSGSDLGAVRMWEPVIYSPARKASVRDVIHAGAPTGFRMQAGLTGTKPHSFATWVFRLLGAEPGDTLADLYPGSGAVSRAWEKFNPQLQLPSFAGNGRMRPRHKYKVLSETIMPLFV